ncbi:hypothetical protein DFQ27_002160, partial [Actinomortierella ambigua]
MALMHAIMRTHWGNLTTPGSLQFLVARLKLKRVNNKNKSDFHAGSEFLRVAGIAMCRHLWDVEGQAFRARFGVDQEGENWSSEAKMAFHEWVNDLFFGSLDEEVEQEEEREQMEDVTDDHQHMEYQRETQEGEGKEWEWGQGNEVEYELEDMQEQEQELEQELEQEEEQEEEEQEHNDEFSVTSRNARLFVRDVIIFQELAACIRI